MASASLAVPLQSLRADESLGQREESLAQQIGSAIRAATIWPIPGLFVKAEEGVVTLRGRTRSFYEKQIVIHAARHVPGVKQIVDEIHVRPGGSR